MLFYRDDGLLDLRVFPFAAGETRYTGFEIIHGNSFDFEIDGHRVDVQGSEILETVYAQDSTVMAIPAQIKKQLPKYYRKPIYHFIVDNSIHATAGNANFGAKIKRFLKKIPLPQATPKSHC